MPHVAASGILEVCITQGCPATLAVVAYFFVVLEAAFYAMAEWRHLPSMWHFPKSKWKQAALGSPMLTLLLVFSNHPDRFWIMSVALLCTGILVYGLSDYLFRPYRNIAAFCLCFSVGCTVIGSLVYEAWPRERFIVQAEFVENGMAVYNLALWEVQQGYVYPVGIAAYVRLESDHPKSEMIDTISFQIKTTGGTWASLTEMELGDFYWGARNKSYPLGSPLLRGELTNRNLQPGDHVGGWIFWDYPKWANIKTPNFDLYEKNALHMDIIAPGTTVIIRQGVISWETIVPPYIPEFRAVVTDMNNETFVVPVTLGPHRWGDPQTIYLSVSGSAKAQNISGLPIKFARLSE